MWVAVPRNLPTQQCQVFLRDFGLWFKIDLTCGSTRAETAPEGEDGASVFSIQQVKLELIDRLSAFNYLTPDQITVSRCSGEAPTGSPLGNDELVLPQVWLIAWVEDDCGRRSRSQRTYKAAASSDVNLEEEEGDRTVKDTPTRGAPGVLP